MDINLKAKKFRVEIRIPIAMETEELKSEVEI